MEEPECLGFPLLLIIPPLRAWLILHPGLSLDLSDNISIIISLRHSQHPLFLI